MSKKEISVGVLGGGQLGRMLALAGYPLGMRFRFLDPSPDAPAGHLAEHILGSYEDPIALKAFSAGMSVVTYEFENVPVGAAHLLASRVPLYPPPLALEVAQDRINEKAFLQDLGIPTPAFAAVTTHDELRKALESVSTPAILKTRRFGYDGRGQFFVHDETEIETAWKTLGGKPLILEAYVPFTRELSIIAVRARDGQTAFYPLIENQHREGILRLSLAPAPRLTSELQAAAETYAARVLDALNYVGVLCIELFDVSGKLLANEIAPRVHNSGHWSIEGAETSQFENHLRAIAVLPLGSTTPRGWAAMLNIISSLPDMASVLAIPGAHLHLYGKDPRPGRKLGHVTVTAPDPSLLLVSLKRLQGLLD